MTATHQDVMLALLSLDAYSRGTVRQLEHDGSELSRSIGTAIWSKGAENIDGALAAGFSASSYTLASGETVIEPAKTVAALRTSGAMMRPLALPVWTSENFDASILPLLFPAGKLPGKLQL